MGWSWQLLSIRPDLRGYLGLHSQFECLSRDTNSKWSCGVPACPQVSQIRCLQLGISTSGNAQLVATCGKLILSDMHSSRPEPAQQRSTAQKKKKKNQAVFPPNLPHCGPLSCCLLQPVFPNSFPVPGPPALITFQLQTSPCRPHTPGYAAALCF